jgi:hypothetical protein
MIKEGIAEMRRTQLGSPLGASVALSSEPAPFTSEFVGSILATDSCEKSQSTLCPKVVGFLRVLRFPPTGKVDRVG